MSLSIIGAGNVGQALAGALAARGENITFGVSDPAKHASLASQYAGKAQVRTVREAIEANEIVTLAVPYAAAESVARAVPDWNNRILVDATNPLAPGLAGLLLGTTTSGAEAIAQAAKGARVVKAFNTTGAENMADTRYPGGRPFMPICGDDEEARAKVAALATLIGFDAVDLGELAAARYLEPFAMVWIHLAFKRGLGRSFAFSLLRRGS